MHNMQIRGPGPALDCRDGGYGILTREAEISPGSLNAETRELDVIASVGAPVRRYDWERGVYFMEELEMTPQAVDLTRVTNRVCPLVYGHNWHGSGSQQLGLVETAEIKSGQLIERVRFGVDVNPFIEEKWKLVEQRLLNGLSVGYRVYEYKLIRAKDEYSLDRYIATKWEQIELSFLLVPADVEAVRI